MQYIIMMLSPIPFTHLRRHSQSLTIYACFSDCQGYVQKVLCSENVCSKGSMFRRFYIQKVLCSEGPMFRRSYVQKVLYNLEGPMFRRSYDQKIFVQKILYSEGSMFRRFYVQKVLYSDMFRRSYIQKSLLVFQKLYHLHVTEF